MTVLVTGGAGFIGSHLCRALVQAGEPVVCVDNFNDFYAPQRKRANVADLLDHERFVLCEADIRDGEAMEDIFRRHEPERVAHLAALPGVMPSVRDPILYEQVNVGGTVQVLRAAVQRGVRTLVLASSSSVYGATTRVPFHEDDPADRPLSPYAATKRASEVISHAFAHLYGLNVLVARFFNAYGPAGRPDMAPAIFTRAVHRGEPIRLAGNVKRDYTYIDDIVAGLLGALTWENGYEIVNLGNSHPVSMTDFIATVEDVVDKKASVEHLPGLPADAPITYADVSKAGRLFGYAPQTSLRDGLARTYQWLLDQEKAGLG